MQWSDVKDNWSAFVDRISQRWPNTDQTELLDLEGDFDRFVDYLARSHELTTREAQEQIEAFLQGEIPLDVQLDEARDNENIVESARHIPPGEDVYAEDRDFGDEDVEDSPVGRTG